MVRYIAGDIGGTNSRLHLMEITHDVTNPSHTIETLIVEQIYPSQKYSSLTFIIEKFIREAKSESEELYPIAACLAVAGPVRANKITFTNVNWTLDGDEMAIQLRMKRVQIINDFVGIGFGLLALEREDVIPVNDVPFTDQAPKAAIGAGTGLGEVFLTWSGVEYDVWASEGGHTDFAPRDETEFRLMEYLKRTERVDRISVERVVSGLGLPKIYNFFCETHPEEVSAEVTKRLLSEDKGAVIAEYAKSGKCNLCRQSVDLMIKAYGAEAGNLALKTLPMGGLYIAGGIAPKLLWAMEQDHQFWNNFVNKGRMRGLLEKVPVFIITNQSVGLLGAKVVGKRLLRAEGFAIKGELATFSESTPRNIDLLQRDDVEADVNVSGNKVESIVVRKKLPQGRERRKSRANIEMKGALVNPNGKGTVSDAVLIRAAVIGGVIASVTTLLLNTFINKSRKL